MTSYCRKGTNCRRDSQVLVRKLLLWKWLLFLLIDCVFWLFLGNQVWLIWWIFIKRSHLWISECCVLRCIALQLAIISSYARALSLLHSQLKPFVNFYSGFQIKKINRDNSIDSPTYLANCLLMIDLVLITVRFLSQLHLSISKYGKNQTFATLLLRPQQLSNHQHSNQ